VKGTKPRMSTTPEAITRAPPVPSWLSEDAKAEWRRVMPALAARRILTVADIGSVESYCVAVGRVRQIEREIQKTDTLNGTLFRMQASAIQTARQLASELGLTPVSRSRPSVRDLESDPDADPLVDI